MAIVSDGLARYLDREVIDGTGLTGEFDLDLEWAAGELISPGAHPGTTVVDGASIFTAVQEQLGLKLEPMRASVDVLVVERGATDTELVFYLDGLAGG